MVKSCVCCIIKVKTTSATPDDIASPVDRTLMIEKKLKDSFDNLLYEQTTVTTVSKEMSSAQVISQEELTGKTMEYPTQLVKDKTKAEVIIEAKAQKVVLEQETINKTVIYSKQSEHREELKSEVKSKDTVIEKYQKAELEADLKSELMTQDHEVIHEAVEYSKRLLKDETKTEYKDRVKAQKAVLEDSPAPAVAFKTQTHHEARVELESVLRPKTKVETEATPKPEPKLELKTKKVVLESRSELAVAPKTELKLEHKVEVKAQKVEHRLEPAIAPKAEPKPEPKTELRAAVKAESKVEPKATPKLELKPESKVLLKPKDEFEPKPEPKAEAKAQRAVSQPEPAVAGMAEPMPQAKVELMAAPKSEPRATPMPEPQAAPKPKSKVELKPEPKVKVKAQEVVSEQEPMSREKQRGMKEDYSSAKEPAVGISKVTPKEKVQKSPHGEKVSIVGKPEVQESKKSLKEHTAPVKGICNGSLGCSLRRVVFLFLFFISLSFLLHFMAIMLLSNPLFQFFIILHIFCLDVFVILSILVLSLSLLFILCLSLCRILLLY